MSNFIGRALSDLKWKTWYPIEDAVQWTWYHLTKCQYVALVEAVKGGVSVGMMRTPAYRWHWVAKLVSRYVAFKLRDKGDEFRVRILDPDRALEMESRYTDWLAMLQVGISGT